MCVIFEQKNTVFKLKKCLQFIASTFSIDRLQTKDQSTTRVNLKSRTQVGKRNKKHTAPVCENHSIPVIKARISGIRSVIITVIIIISTAARTALIYEGNFSSLILDARSGFLI